MRRFVLFAAGLLLLAVTPAGASSTLSLTGQTTFVGKGGDVFTLSIESDVIVSLGACGVDHLDSYYCDLDLETDAPFAGLVIHEAITPDSADDFSYLVMAQYAKEFGSDYRETGIDRGFEKVTHDRQSARVLPAGTYVVRLISDGGPVTATLRVDGLVGTSRATGRPGSLEWRDVPLEYGSAQAGGAGADFSTDGVSLSWFAYAWQDPSLEYNVDVIWGVCAYDDHTTLPTTAYAPGCPDRLTGNDAFEFFSYAWLTPRGGHIHLASVGAADDFALGGYHASAVGTGSTSAFALTLPLD